MSKIQTAGANDGECILYGAGMDGVCSIAGKNVEKECGTCSNADKHTEEECGDCSIDPACSCSKCYAETTNFCSIAAGIWTPETWTKGTWTAPDGWTGDSHHTTHIAKVKSTSGYDCYDKIRVDHHAHCKDASVDWHQSACYTEFESNLICPAGCTDTPRDVNAKTPRSCLGTATDPEDTPDCQEAYEASGTAAMCDPGCTFVAAPAYCAKTNKIYSHSRIELMAGWTAEMRSFGDADGTTNDAKNA